MTDGKCSHCDHIITTEAKFCEKCGAPILKKVEFDPLACSQCGARIKTDAKFCIECGTPVKTKTSQPKQIQTTEFSPQQQGVIREIYCPSDWPIYNIKSIIETFSTNYAKDMKLEELKPNMLRLTWDSKNMDSVLEKTEGKCLECGSDLPENAKFCIKCGATKTVNTDQMMQAFKDTTTQGEYSAIFRILDERKKGRYVQIEYNQGDEASREYVKSFWDNFYNGLKSVLEKPFSSFQS
jgi:predicted amidophosphoribosyltransferase